VRSVAEWFVVALAATAETDGRATCQVVFVTGAVIDFDLALDPQRAIVTYGDLRRHRFNSVARALACASNTAQPLARAIINLIVQYSAD
jgi:hypothetical protein